MKIIMTNPEKGYEVLCLVKDDQTVMISYESVCDGLRAANGINDPVGYTITSCQAYLCPKGDLWVDPNCIVLRHGINDSPIEFEEKKYVQWVDYAVKRLKDKLISPKSYLNMRVIPKYFDEPVKIADDGMWNAADMTMQCGKYASDWLSKTSTSRTIRAFLDRYGMPQDNLIKEVWNGKSGHVPGLWLGDRIMPEFCRWLSDDFAVLFNDAITTVLSKASKDNALPIS